MIRWSCCRAGTGTPDGRLHRDFELAILTGREEELLAQARHPRPAALVTELLTRCVRRIGTISPVTPRWPGNLLVADRHYLLLQLRQATFGDRVRARPDLPVAGLRRTRCRSISRSPTCRSTVAAATGTDAHDDAVRRGDRRARRPRGRVPPADRRRPGGAVAPAGRERGGGADRAARPLRPADRDDRHPDEETICRVSPRRPAPRSRRACAGSPRAWRRRMDTRCAECGRTFIAPVRRAAVLLR